MMCCSSQDVDACSRRYRVRTCSGSEDYSAVIGLVDAWWGGRRVSPMLPRLFFDNFCDTTFMAVIRDEEAQKAEAQIAEAQQADAADTTQRDEVIVGFLCGFVSQSRAGEAHAHFIGIDPAHRGAGLGALLYDQFFKAVQTHGCTLVHAVTSPANTASVAFHKAIGFEAVPAIAPDAEGDERTGGTGKARSSSGASEHRFLSEHSGRVPVDRELVHLDYDGPDDGDRVVLEKRL
ncbi:unnamed protein product [Ectocarpus sp. CCAP 1310/34]|nr:unnamed protein product [Ectocarpus sp. CCAP 1310/34]